MAISRAEREDVREASYRDLITAARMDLHTAMPGIIQSFDAARMTCTIQPAIRGAIVQPSGQAQAVDLPMLVDCPVVFPGGGGYILTYPLKAGDECLVVFSERCIDAWWQSGGVQAAAEYRLHDLSDGFVIPGPRSQPHVVTGGVGMTGAELRTDSGTTVLRLNGSTIEIVAPGGVTLNTPTVTMTHDLYVKGDFKLDGDMDAGGFGYLEHTHTGVHGETSTPHVL